MNRLLSVEDARLRMLDGVGPGPSERVQTESATGRVLAEAVSATRDQPPFNASAMDGWAVRSPADHRAQVTLNVIGESAAGRPYRGRVSEGEAVRIFTGAPVPADCDRVVPQELVQRHGEVIRLGPLEASPLHVRARGGDFTAGERLIEAGVRLDPWRLTLVAAAGAEAVVVAPRPTLSLIATGEEIVAPGGVPDDGQIYDSASYALQARAVQWGARVRGLTLAGDDAESIRRSVAAAEGELLVFIGGASVGDYDLIKPTLTEAFGMRLMVEGVNVRPGKPTWFGRLEDGRPVLGLPGNPASALVCAELFLGPVLQVWQGAAPGPTLTTAQLSHPLPANGGREHWMRALTWVDARGVMGVRTFPDQDSSLVTVFAQSNALLRRAGDAAASAAGEAVALLQLDRA